MSAAKPTIVALGEILWDMFSSGPRFGGAPANFSYHASALGASVSILSSVGNDELGDAAIGKLRDSAIDTRFISRSENHPTGMVNVEIDAGGHATYRFRHEEAWDHIPWTDQLQELASSANAVCFGTLAQRHQESRSTIRKFIEATPPRTLRVLDLNLRAPFFDDEVIESSLTHANILKLNDEELSYIARLFVNAGDEISQAQQLAKRFDLQAIAVTRGSRGGVLIRDDEVSHASSQPTTVRDTVGAGDSFTAAVTVGFLKQMPLDDINRAACRIAEFVCSHNGATPKLPDEWLDEMF